MVHLFVPVSPPVPPLAASGSLSELYEPILATSLEEHQCNCHMSECVNHQPVQ